MDGLLAERGRATLGQWLGVGLLALGVLTGQLGPAQLLVAAWLENVSVGIATLVALVRDPGGRVSLGRRLDGRGDVLRVDRTATPPAATQPVASSPPPSRPPPGAPLLQRGPDGEVLVPGGCLAPFFLFHYGLFTVVHGVFVGLLAFGSTVVFGDVEVSSPADVVGGPLAVVLLVAAAVVRAFRRVDPQRAILDAYTHVVPLHLAIFVVVFGLGGFLATGVLEGPGQGLVLRVGPVVVSLLLLALFAGSDALRLRRRDVA